MASPATAQSLPTQLNIVAVSGDGAVDAPGRPSTAPPTVRVEDENHKPVANAVVAFTLPTEGATGEFGNRSKTITMTTDAAGLAVAKGLRTNQVPGKVPIHIDASYRGLTAHTSMLQFNVAGAPGEKAGHGGRVAAILLALAGAAGGGAYMAMRNPKSAAAAAPAVTPPTPIGITPGTGTVGAPH